MARHVKDEAFGARGGVQTVDLVYLVYLVCLVGRIGTNQKNQMNQVNKLNAVADCSCAPVRRRPIARVRKSNS